MPFWLWNWYLWYADLACVESCGFRSVDSAGDVMNFCSGRMRVIPSVPWVDGAPQKALANTVLGRLSLVLGDLFLLLLMGRQSPRFCDSPFYLSRASFSLQMRFSSLKPAPLKPLTLVIALLFFQSIAQSVLFDPSPRITMHGLDAI